MHSMTAQHVLTLITLVRRCIFCTSVNCAFILGDGSDLLEKEVNQ